MSVSYHSHAIRCDADDVERAAGALETVSKTSSDAELAIAAHGAAMAMYALATHDIKTHDDMLTIWSMLMTRWEVLE